MAGRHTAKTSKAPFVIVCILLVAVVAVIGAIIFMNFFGNSDLPETSSQPVTTIEPITVSEDTAEASQQTTVQPTTKEQGVTASENEKETIDVAVPTKNGEDIRYFNASYVPYKAVDSASGTQCSLREVFGSAYAGGVITFNSDGTFTDTLTSSVVDSGAYAVEGDSIVATYTNDKNMSITVNSWDGDSPSDFVINYGGYDVYFEN